MACLSHASSGAQLYSVQKVPNTPKGVGLQPEVCPANMESYFFLGFRV